jgi:hypothetical protein
VGRGGGEQRSEERGGGQTACMAYRERKAHRWDVGWRFAWVVESSLISLTLC